MTWELKERFGVWRPWFAWHPVRMTGTPTVVWLETVERHCELINCGMGGSDYEYTYRRAQARTEAA